MKIAVTYENGEVFGHFGHTKEFKVYTVDDGKVISSEILNADGEGHGALAALLADEDIAVLICGGIGGGAVSALNEKDIEICSGATGDTDKAVEAYLNGTLSSAGENCDHHDEEHSCSHGSEGCGGCSGCHPTNHITGKNAGKIVRAHYRGTFDNGEQFDSSYDRGEPLEFICGAGMMIKGFDAAVANMEVGEKVKIHLMPEEAYGEKDPSAIFTVEQAMVEGSEELTVGQQLYLTNQVGQPFRVEVVAKDDKTITFDANHEMAGKELNFEIELVEVK